MKSVNCFLALIFILSWSSIFATEEDPLHKRKFTIGLSETRNGVVAKKVINDVIYFKNGKLFTEFFYNKFGFKWVRYRINKDSVYTDHTNTEVRLLEVEAVATDERNQTLLMEFSVLEWDIDGIVKITKNDKLKRYYDLAGREKGGKPKKVKVKKHEPDPQQHAVI
jgi:hypothetical protein